MDQPIVEFVFTNVTYQSTGSVVPQHILNNLVFNMLEAVPITDGGARKRRITRRRSTRRRRSTYRRA